MSKPRAPTAAKALKQCLCAPNGTLHDAGMLVMSDLAKFCNISTAPVRHDASGKIDPLATFIIVGRQEVYQRLQTLLALQDHETYGLATLQWPEPDTD